MNRFRRMTHIGNILYLTRLICARRREPKAKLVFYIILEEICIIDELNCNSYVILEVLEDFVVSINIKYA